MSDELYEGELYEFPGEMSTESWEFASNETFEGEGELGMETELAMELLEITTEEELDQFLGKLARGVIRGASKFVKSPIGKMIGNTLRSVAKSALPVVGGALGNLVAPGLGGMIGSKLGSAAGNLLEEGEGEMMGEIAAQHEAARRYVRFARATYRNAARTPRSVPANVAARAALTGAARMYAPSLLGGGRNRGWRSRRRGYGQPMAGYGFDDGYGDNSYGDSDRRDDQHGSEGRWVRRGNRVTLIGL